MTTGHERHTAAGLERLGDVLPCRKQARFLFLRQQSLLGNSVAMARVSSSVMQT